MSKKNQKNTSILESLPEDQKDFFLLSLEKKVRNLNKKLKEINQLELERKEGKELNEAQLKKISSRDEHNSKIKEQESIAKLYLEAKEEAGPQQPLQVNISDLIAEAAIQISHLYYASLFAHQTKPKQNELNLAYQNIFNNIAENRVETSAAELTAYASGQLGDLQAQVREVISSDEFVHYHKHVAEVEERVIIIMPPKHQDAEHVVNQAEEEINQEEEEEEQQQQQEQQNQENTQAQQQNQQEPQEEAQIQVAFVEVAQHTQTQQQEQQQQQQDHQQQHQDQQQQPQDPAQDNQKKTYTKRTHSGGNRGHRAQKPREGEQQNQDGNTNPENQDGQHQQHRRGPRTNYNKKPQNQDNQNNGEANDGWNVVRKGTGPQEGSFKQNRPFNKEQREHKEHREGGKRPENQGEKRQNHSGNGNRRPFNNNRSDHQAQYVRKDQAPNNQPATTEPQQQQQQQANQTN